MNKFQEQLAKDVAIPSIQVGFFTPSLRKVNSTRPELSQSLLFRSVFSLVNISTKRCGQSCWSQSLLFRSVFSLDAFCIATSCMAWRRNPFYSGRFFHSFSGSRRPSSASTRSQSLLFRSVFSLGCNGRELSSQQRPSQSLLFRSVFSLTVREAELMWCPMMSQSLLFRSVFSLGGAGGGLVQGFAVAIPSIQVGFFTPRKDKGCHGLTPSRRNPFYSGRFFHSEIIPVEDGKTHIVAIPSIQVGFFTRSFFRHKDGDHLVVAIPSIQVGFFTRYRIPRRSISGG